MNERCLFLQPCQNVMTSLYNKPKEIAVTENYNRKKQYGLILISCIVPSE